MTAPPEAWQLFSRNLAAARRVRGVSAADLASRIAGLGFGGPSATRIRQLEAGGRPDAGRDLRDRAANVRLREVIACAAGLGVAPVHLLGCADEEPAPQEVALVARGLMPEATPEVRVGEAAVPTPSYRNWLTGTAPLTPDLDDLWMYYVGFVPRGQRARVEAKADEAAPGTRRGDARVFLARERPEHLAILRLQDELAVLRAKGWRAQ